MVEGLYYFPQYCIASAVATTILIIMYCMKRNFATRSNRLFFIMLVDNLFASLINITTFFVIAFPERYPLWLCNLSNQVYLFVYNLMAVLFLLYVDSLSKIPKMRIPVRVTAGVFIGYDFLLLATSPFTHLAIYFDENLVYRHGPLMITLYIIAFVAVALGNIIFITMRKKFNLYQVFAITCFVFCVFSSIIFQVFHPRIVISNFVCSMVLFFVYIAFENQAYYLHGDTPCYNRRAFIKMIHECKKNGNPYITISIHIRDFENIVRILGRSGVDVLSERIAERLSRTFGKMAYCTDLNNFAIVKEGEGDTSDIVERIQKSFVNPFEIEMDDEFRRLRVNPVITVLHVDGEEIEGYEMVEVLRKLEEKSPDAVTEIDDVRELLESLRREKELLHIIDNAIANNGFQVYYQPILDVKSGKFISSEALVRLKDDEGNFISPEEFIPIAEKSGRIHEIGVFVFREVCRFIRDEKLESLGVEYIEINLSPEQCKKEGLTKRITSIMKEYGIDPKQLNLEITETSEVGNYGMDRLNEIMSELHGKGVTFSLDDFGSGFAAINYLTNLPVDIVKIDKGILWQAMKDETSMLILKSTIAMIQEIGRRIVVEGIETEEMAQILRENECDYLQGYLYSKPVPGKEYIGFLRKM